MATYGSGSYGATGGTYGDLTGGTLEPAQPVVTARTRAKAQRDVVRAAGASGRTSVVTESGVASAR
jgi:hypothetical protein